MKPAFALRDAHLAAFAEAARESFEDRMVAHVRLAFRPKYDELGEEGVRRWVRSGIERAATYDLTVEVHVSRFIRLMFQLGENFDRGQAKAMLSRRDVPAPLRLNRVLTMAVSSGALPAGTVRAVGESS